MPYIKENPARFLLSGQGTGVSASGQPMDTRNATNYGFLQYVSYSPSALLILQGSPDSTGWMTVALVTATPTTGSAQIAGYFPYVRGIYGTGYSTTASANMFYAPGLI